MNDVGRWASCGAMYLTGDLDGPPLAPPTSAARMVDDALRPFGLDAAVLSERAALADLGRVGTRSSGGASRLLRAEDGWVVMTLAREDDVASLAAVFEVDDARIGPTGVGARATWATVAALAGLRPAEEVAARSGLLGVPAGVIGGVSQPFRSERRDRRARRSGPAHAPRVVDLSSLWAGPLATSCLHSIGAEVIKIEDRRRPDGARHGNARFFDLLNAGKRSVALDFTDPADLGLLGRLVLSADIVVTAARPRALDRLGLDPDTFLGAGTDRTWVAITAHGWNDHRVGFGDDIAASAGLVAWHTDGAPRFASDAVADPLGGARAADAARRAWDEGGRWFVDASLGGAAAESMEASGEGSAPAQAAEGDGEPWSIAGEPLAPPTARPFAPSAATLGADTAAVIAELG